MLPRGGDNIGQGGSVTPVAASVTRIGCFPPTPARSPAVGGRAEADLTGSDGVRPTVQDWVMTGCPSGSPANCRGPTGLRPVCASSRLSHGWSVAPGCPVAPPMRMPTSFARSRRTVPAPGAWTRCRRDSRLRHQTLLRPDNRSSSSRIGVSNCCTISATNSARPRTLALEYTVEACSRVVLSLTWRRSAISEKR